MRSRIIEINNKLKNNRLNIDEIINNSKKIFLEQCHTHSTISNCYNVIKKEEFKFNCSELLSFIPYSLKDIFCTKNILTTGGSKFYSDFSPPFNSTIYEILLRKQALLVSKANCDEFGMDGTGLSSAYGLVLNYHDNKRIAGGSSSGSVNQVASGEVVFSIGSDTGDSIRKPSSFLGVCGYKPSYGLISRYGMFSFSSSLDCAGVIASYVSDCAIVAQNIVNFDKNDFTSQKILANFFDNIKTRKNIHFAIIDGIEKYLENDVKNEYLFFLDKIKKKNNITKFKISKNILESISMCYKVISYCEAVTQRARDVGIQAGGSYSNGGYEEIYKLSRTIGYGLNVKKRLIIGDILTEDDNYKIFLQAKKIRTLLINELNSILGIADALLLPGASSIAPYINDVKNNKYKSTIADDLLQLANFAGAPSITVPIAKIKKMPFGINITCKQFDDQQMFDIALTLEDLTYGKV
jgi:aspartyl-tRNA(Asn)/glutamyl-tRNA(Gln) amidotransferase subunit A